MEQIDFRNMAPGPVPGGVPEYCAPMRVPRHWAPRPPRSCSAAFTLFFQRRYAQGGMAALGREEGWRRGRRRVSAKHLRGIEMLKSQGMSNRAIAHRLGVSEKAIRKLAGPSKSAESAQLAFAGMTTAAMGHPPAVGLPSAKSTGDDADRAMPSAKDSSDDEDPITAPVDDGEPVPMSLDRDASDRTFDRQLAYLGRSMMPRRCSATGLRLPVSAS